MISFRFFNEQTLAMISYSIRAERTDSIPLRMNCPACGTPDVQAQAWQQAEQILAFHLIPLGGERATTWVQCTQCRETLLSRVSLPELQILPPHQAGDWLRVRASLPAQLMAVLSVGLFWAPGIGLFVAILAWLLNRKSRSWTRKCSRIGLGANLFVSLALLLLFAVDVIVNGLPK